MGFAEPVIGRAFARPVGSTHPTIFPKFLLTIPQIGSIFLSFRPTEGRFAIVTIRWAWDAMAVVASGVLHRTKTSAADGEVVWSWRRDPGATLAEIFPPATGARKAASPRRARRKP